MLTRRDQAARAHDDVVLDHHPVHYDGTHADETVIPDPAPMQQHLVPDRNLSADLEGRLEVTLQTDVEALADGEYLYVRVTQQDGGAAWSSPFFAREAADLGEAR